MWNFAYCDKGHLPDDVSGLKLKILPADDVDPEALLNELMRKKRVVRVSSEYESFLFMPKFERHQKADQRWKTRCPACALGDSLKLTKTQASLVEHTETLPNSALRGEERTREDKREEKNTLVQAALERDFDSFWNVYPRKQGKQAAKKKYMTVRKTVDAETIQEGVRNYALMTLGKEREFIKLPAGWLNDGRFEDEFSTSIPQPPRELSECRIHPGYPLPCDACAREEVNPF